MSAPVLIVGAGPTGLALALFLTELGVAVRIVDKAAEPGTTSRALAVQARTLETYHQYGIDRSVIDGGVKVGGINLWVGSRAVARVPMDALGTGLSPYPYALIYPQDAHERLLIDRLAALGVAVERPVELASYESGPDGVSAILRHADGREERETFAYLAGCDGARSRVREVLGTGFPGGTYSGLFYVADVAARGPVVNHEIHVEIDHSDFMAVFPLKDLGHLRLIGAITWDPATAPPEPTFEDIHPRAAQNLRIEIGKANWFSTYRVHHRVASAFRVGRTFLLGDAAHIHSPVGGQGMNTGICDAANLAWKLAAVIRRQAPETLLDTYEPERRAFALQLVATTDRAFTFVIAQGPIAKFVRTKIVPFILPKLWKLAFFRRFMFHTIAQIRMNYRGSSLSEGAAGSVRAGERLPWVALGASDNFAPLAPPRWQAHVYGAASDVLRAACADLRLPLHEFAWTGAMKAAGLQRDALYLLRPDGYVALADADADPQRLRDHLGKWDITF